MGEVEECDHFWKILKAICQYFLIKDDDINKLVDVGFTSKYVLTGASKDDFLGVLPS